MIKGIRSFFYIGLVLLTILSCSQETASNGVEVINDQLDVDEEFVKQALALTKDENQLVLTEGALGDIYFMGNTSEIQVEDLEYGLNFYNIEIVTYDGFDKNGEMIYYVGWKGGQIFSLTLDSERKNRAVKTLNIMSKGVVDQYGVKPGMKYNQLLLLRKEGRIHINPITSQPEVVFKNSSIYYSFCCSEDQQKQEYSSEDLQNMKIQSINWDFSYNTPE